MKLKIEYILILILFLYIIYLRQCNKCPLIENKKEIKYKYITDTVPEYIPKITNTRDSFFIFDTSFVLVDNKIDTNAILADYFRKYEYSDTIDRDSIKIYIVDNISNNRIISRNVSYTMRQTIITNNLLIKERNFFLGCGINNFSVISQVSPELGLLYKSRKDNIIGLNVGYNITIQDPYMGFKIYYKIK